jgi:DNA-directed RNA polymerase specialized sigma24 family protein
VDEARYRLALRVAKAGFRRLGRRSIDGKEPHDIAMESLHVEPWFPRIVWCDVIDAYRRERGRPRSMRLPGAERNERNGRRMVGLPAGLVARTVERLELGLVLKNRTEVLVCELLAAGYEQAEVAAVVGVTHQRISQIIGNIRRRNAEPLQGSGGGGGGTEEPAG